MKGFCRAIERLSNAVHAYSREDTVNHVNSRKITVE